MELAQILSWLSEKTPEFVVGFALGLLIALFISYLYLLPKFVKSATAQLTTQVELLSRQSELLILQVNNQTQHIANLELQIKRLETELEPYRAFANTQLARIISAEQNI